MPDDSAILTGRCHCGNLEVVFETRLRPEQLELRACTCGFCARHGARCVSDSSGRLRITVRDRDRLIRYRFALRTADFLICALCGIYVGAVIAEGSASRAIVNVNVLDAAARFARTPIAMCYGAETEAERRARRGARWTPAVLTDAAGRPL